MITPQTTSPPAPSPLEQYFAPYRQKIVGIQAHFQSPYGTQPIIYADWIASGRLYQPIENILANEIGVYVANTHTETTATGTTMTLAYHQAHKTIKHHVNAAPTDVIITTGSGMTGVVNKFQRILGLKVPERLANKIEIPDNERPVVFVTHMEHHSNHTSWLETIADVVCVPPNSEGLVDLQAFQQAIEQYTHRPLKIAAVTSCSNVTGIFTPYYDIAELIHQYGGYCFVDFACSAPYVPIDMHPTNRPQASLDAIFFSPHKFLGGPGTTGVLIFNSTLYKNRVPDQPGGGTVNWTNPWGQHSFVDDIEAREDGGTPAFLQTIKAALAIALKEQMNTQQMLLREEELLQQAFDHLLQIPNLHILAPHIQHRLGVISFYINGLHYNLGVKILNDRFGIQVRGGCSCAGTYGHYLLNVTPNHSHRITAKIDNGDLTEKPGWIRLSLHPTMTNAELHYILQAITSLAANYPQWQHDYTHDLKCNEFRHKNHQGTEQALVNRWFTGAL
jgi:YD repeat-containing protein